MRLCVSLALTAIRRVLGGGNETSANITDESTNNLTDESGNALMSSGA